MQAIASRLGLRIATFGHAGDGNMHPTIIYDGRDAEEVVRARAAFAAIVKLAQALGATATGEHGVGTLKLHLAHEELGPAASVHRAVTDALDPFGILNPGTVLM